MIKAITLEDCPELIPLLTEFSQEAEQEFYPEVFSQIWGSLERGGIAQMFGSFDEGKLCGAISVVITPDLRTGRKTATECFWFVTNEYRDTRRGFQLLKHMIDWCDSVEIEDLIMVHLDYLNEERLERIYTKLGFKPLEKHYQLRIR